MAATLVGSGCPDTARVPLPTASPLPACSAPPLPDGPCPVCPRLAVEFEPWRQAGYWKARHDRALKREALLQQRVAELEAQRRLREQQLFGKKTETSAATPPPPPAPAPRPGTPPRRRRGQQPGRPGPRRRDHSHLPAVLEDQEIPGDQCCCRRWGRPFAPVSGTEDSTILEIAVKAHRRLIRRHRYRPTCDCGAAPGLSTAPPAPRVIPNWPSRNHALRSFGGRFRRSSSLIFLGRLKRDMR